MDMGSVFDRVAEGGAGGVAPQEKEALDKHIIVGYRGAMTLPEMCFYNNKSMMDSVYACLAKYKAIPDEVETGKEELSRAVIIKARIPHKFLPRNSAYDMNFWQSAVRTARAYADGAKSGDKKNLFIFGPSFIGKSILAARVLYDCLAELRPGYWLNIPEHYSVSTTFVSGYQSGIPRDMTDRAKSAKILVLDDMGKSYAKTRDERELSYYGNVLYDIIESRRGRPTVITAEFCPDDLRPMLTDAVVNRIIEDAVIIDGTHAKKWEGEG